MVGTMRIPPLRCVLSAVVLMAVCLAPAGAQSALHPVSDTKGLFSISIPSDWRVANSRTTDVVFRDLTGPVGRYVVSTLAAYSAGDNTGVAPGVSAFLAVAAVDLPQGVSTEMRKEELPSWWTVTQDGRATIAGRDAHYLYAIDHQNGYNALYTVMAFFNVGRIGFIVIGGTLNEQDSIRKHFATISHILETFRPNPKLGALSVR